MVHPLFTQPASVAEVKKARKLTCLSQEKFAKCLGLSTDTIRAWEQGKRIPEVVVSKIIRMVIDNPKFIETIANPKYSVPIEVKS